MKNSIKTKISKLVLLSITITSILLLVVVYFSVIKLKTDINKEQNNLSSAIVNNSTDYIFDLTKENMKNTLSDKTNIIENNFIHLQKSVQMVADAVTYQYEHTDEYSLMSINEPDKKNEAILTPQVLYSSKIENPYSPEISEEVSKLANNVDLLYQINDKFPALASNYIAAKSGIMIMVDKISAEKFSDGSDIPDKYEAETRPWYIGAKENDGVYFTDVTPDVNGTGNAIMCGIPFYKYGKFMGVAGAGMYLNDISKIIDNTIDANEGFAFIVNKRGNIIFSSKKEGELSVSLDKGSVIESDNENITKLGNEIFNNDLGVSEAKIDSVDYLVTYSKMDTIGWSFVIATDKKIIMEMPNKLNGAILDLSNVNIGSIDNIIQKMIVLLIIVIVAIVLLLLIITSKASTRISQPIIELTENVVKVSGNNLDFEYTTNTGDEIEELANSFRDMTLSLKDFIANLASVTAEKERIGAELNVAKTIQASMLPCIFPPYPDRKEFDIYATMEPAKEVGGDFYDFFMSDDKHLWLVMADVSGKGVPAALFMVVAKTLIKNSIEFNDSPVEVMRLVNDRLAENNDAVMFVTTFIGVLDTQTGEFRFANAGHNFPLIYNNEESKYDWLKTKPNFVLAAMPGIKFNEHKINIKPGDKIYLYTDGVTEAMNKQRELYGDDRLYEILNTDKCISMDNKELLPYIRKDLLIFADGADQADDITMLSVSFEKYFE